MNTFRVGCLAAGLLSLWASGALAQAARRPPPIRNAAATEHALPDGRRGYKLKTKGEPASPAADSLRRHVAKMRRYTMRRGPAATVAAPQQGEASGGFPWPPRPYSEQVNLSRSLFGSARTLGEADAHMGQVLTKAGYRSFRYYPLPQQPGYALVTKFEQIKKSYDPMPEAARWSLNTTPCPDFSLFCVAHTLVFPTSGYWRVFVFVVTERPLPAPVGAAPGWEEGQSWFGKGSNLLPEALRNQPLTAKHYPAMLVYEFWKQEGQAVVMLSQCRLDGVAQLQRAGVRY